MTYGLPLFCWEGIRQNMKDYYSILRLSPDATREEILEAYRRRAWLFHPDRLMDLPTAAARREADEEMKLLNEAREVLTDPQKRSSYDRQRQGSTARAEPKRDHAAENNSATTSSRATNAGSSPPQRTAPGTRAESANGVSLLKELYVDERPVSLAFSPSGRLLASGHEGLVKLWDTSTWRLQRSVPECDSMKGKRDVKQLLFSPDSQWLVSRTSEAVNVLEIETGIWIRLRERRERKGLLSRFSKPPHEHPHEAIALDPSTGSLAVVDYPKIELWSTQTWSLIRTMEGIIGCLGFVFLPDSEVFATVERAWSFSDNKQKCYIGLRSRTDSHRVRTLGSADYHGGPLAMSPDQTLLSTHIGSEVQVWHIESRRLLHRLPAAENLREYTPTFSRDSRLLAYYDKPSETECRYLVLSLGDARVAQRIAVPESYHRGFVTFSPVADLLATTLPHTIQIWQVDL